MLSQTSFAISHDETRYALNGVLFALSGKEMRLVATDGHRLALSFRTLGEIGRPVTGIVPRKAIAEIMRVLGTGEEVQLAITENQFVLQMPNFVMTARLIEGQFPELRSGHSQGAPGQVGDRAGRSHGGASPRLGHGRGAEQAGQAASWLPRPYGSAPRARIWGRPRRLWTSTMRARRSRSASTLAMSSTPSAPVENEQVVLEFKDALSPGVVKSVDGRGILLCYNAHADLAMVFARKNRSLRGC